MTGMSLVKWLGGEELVTPVNDMLYSADFDVPQVEPILYET
jgi:hypothetical protein